MSVYSEILRLALERDSEDRSISGLVSRALSLHAQLGGTGDAASRLSLNLEYDVVLIRLCEALGIGQQLTMDIPEVAARRDAEYRLAERLPAVGSALLSNMKGPQA